MSYLPLEIGRPSAVLGGALLAWQVVASAQQPSKLPTVGFLGPIANNQAR
jgi:hypothetical protein